jgi:hypothetical protein
VDNVARLERQPIFSGTIDELCQWTKDLQSKVKIMLDPIQFKQKPDKDKDIPGISNRLSSSPVDINIRELAKLASSGYNFTCGYYGKPSIKDKTIHRKDECWTSQQIFGLDFDNTISFDDFMEICKRYNIYPTFAYATFSYTKECQKFRAIFMLDAPVTDKRVRSLIIESLMEVFNRKADQQCRDTARLFFGGKALLREDYDARLNIVGLMQAVCLKFKEDDPTHTRKIEAFCRKQGKRQITPTLPNRWGFIFFNF